MEEITITMIDHQILTYQKEYDKLQEKFRLPDADFEQLGIMEDLISDILVDLSKLRYEIMFEQTKDSDYIPLYCR